MKKLVMLAEESVFSGVVKCGVAEMVDSLANSLSLDYDVYMVCPEGNGLYARAGGKIDTLEEGVKTCRFSNVNYYMITKKKWPSKAIEIINRLEPDIFHNFTQPGILSKLATKPAKSIFTFDSTEQISGVENDMYDYDSVTTTSVCYAGSLMRQRNGLSVSLMSTDFHGVTNGIMTAAFAPEKGLLLPAKYTSTNQYGKYLCKRRLTETYGFPSDACVYLMMCRLVKEKGIEEVINAASTIRDSGGMLLVVGKGDPEYEEQLNAFTHSDGVFYLDHWASPLQAAPLAAGADFFLQPSIMEPCGLMPMTASRYGAIPIVTLNGGLADNFNEENAIIVYDSLSDAILQAAALYADKTALTAKRQICMEQDFSWTTRKQGYIDLYEKE